MCHLWTAPPITTVVTTTPPRMGDLRGVMHSSPYARILHTYAPTFCCCRGRAAPVLYTHPSVSFCAFPCTHGEGAIAGHAWTVILDAVLRGCAPWVLPPTVSADTTRLPSGVRFAVTTALFNRLPISSYSEHTTPHAVGAVLPYHLLPACPCYLPYLPPSLPTPCHRFGCGWDAVLYTGSAFTWWFTRACLPMLPTYPPYYNGSAVPPAFVRLYRFLPRTTAYNRTRPFGELCRTPPNGALCDGLHAPLPTAVPAVAR